ncbi:MAG: hypothetical protein VB108_02680 [Anaerolineaceae bacterium]|nr:hypothetical protein [Anaerolineaceae bacterium]
MTLSDKKLMQLFEKWIEILRLKNNWDIKLELVDSDDFKKTGDFKVDPDVRTAILMLNKRNPKEANLEEVIAHELLHLKLYPLDQVTEGLIEAHYSKETPEYEFAYTQFMTSLEQTVNELAKSFLGYYGEDKEISFGRCKDMPSFDELFNGLKPL